MITHMPEFLYCTLHGCCVMPPRSAFKRSEVVYSDHCMLQNLRVMSPTRTVLAGAVKQTAFDQTAVGFMRRAPP